MLQINFYLRKIQVNKTVNQNPMKQSKQFYVATVGCIIQLKAPLSRPS